MRKPEKIAYDKRYYQEHREEHIAKSKEYYLKNREKILTYSKDRYFATRDEYRDRDNARSRKNYLLNRDKSLAWQKEHHKKHRLAVLELLGGAFCKSCGFTDWRALQVDHVNGGGGEERRRHGGKSASITRKKQLELIYANPQKYQVLCANCNWIKKYEKGEVAKKRREINQQTQG